MRALSASTISTSQVEELIRSAENRAGSASLLGARLMGFFSLALLLFALTPAVGVLFALMATIGGFVTWLLWNEGSASKNDIKNNRALIIWEELGKTEEFGASVSYKVSGFARDIARIYKLDPAGEVLPLSQAVRLALVWKQQQQRLTLVTQQTGKMQSLRASLLEKQKMLRDLGDSNAGLERTLAHLDAELGPLERSCDALKASCLRLEAIVVSVEAAARRRQIHREVGQLTSQISLNAPNSFALELSDEQLDLERQITREIETFLQLERETDAHWRDV